MSKARPRVCAVVTHLQYDRIRDVEPLADLWEVRIDLIGPDWAQLIPYLHKPWIACNRIRTEGGMGQEDEAVRKGELLKALNMGASVVDIELNAPCLREVVSAAKDRAQCLISYHNFNETPPLKTLLNIVEREVLAGADICKVVTNAHSIKDSLTMLQLASYGIGKPLISFAMGAEGVVSRILGPLVGGWLTYASIPHGGTTAPGQLDIEALTEFYRLLTR